MSTVIRQAATRQKRFWTDTFGQTRWRLALSVCGAVGCTSPIFLPLDAGDPAQLDATAVDDASPEKDAAEPRLDASGDTGQGAGTLTPEAGTDAGMPPPDAGMDAATPTPDAGMDAGTPTTPEAGADAQVLLDATLDSGARLDAQQPEDAAQAEDVTPPAADVEPITLNVTIATDEDDGVWALIHGQGPLAELTHYTLLEHQATGDTVEVSTDIWVSRTGLRFQLPLARGARIITATLTLTRVGEENGARPSDTMLARVFESDNVAPFNNTHQHAAPADHAAEGLWAQSVGGFLLGSSGGRTTSPDLSALVQHVIDRPGWTPNAYVGFVLSPDLMPPGTWAEYADSFGGPAAVLSLSYR